jgi:hypothetical protein
MFFPADDPQHFERATLYHHSLVFSTTPDPGTFHHGHHEGWVYCSLLTINDQPNKSKKTTHINRLPVIIPYQPSIATHASILYHTHTYIYIIYIYINISGYSPIDPSLGRWSCTRFTRHRPLPALRGHLFLGLLYAYDTTHTHIVHIYIM